MHRIRRNIVSGEELPNIIITYEELAQKPSETMKKLQFKTGLDFNNWQEEINKKKYHLIGGNPKRFEQTTIIQEDTKWRYELSTIEKMCSRLLSIY